MTTTRKSANKLICVDVWAEDDKKQATAWTVHVKGDDATGCEISIIRRNNHHGFRSYGWDEPRSKKILLRGGENLPRRVFLEAIAEAHVMAAALNASEGVFE